MLLLKFLKQSQNSSDGNDVTEFYKLKRKESLNSQNHVAFIVSSQATGPKMVELPSFGRSYQYLAESLPPKLGRYQKLVKNVYPKRVERL